MNNGNGFILLHKSLEKHWISSNAEYFKAWVIMLFNACYEPYKTLCKGQLIPIEVGEIALSYDGWIKKFGNQWTLQKVRTFFDLLENDKMITRSEGYKITKLSIVNFKTYQTEQQVSNKIKVKKTTGTQQVDNKQVTTIEIKETNIKQDKQENNILPAPLPSDDEFKILWHEELSKRAKVLNTEVWEYFDKKLSDSLLYDFQEYCKSKYNTKEQYKNYHAAARTWQGKEIKKLRNYKKPESEHLSFANLDDVISKICQNTQNCKPGNIYNYIKHKDQVGMFENWTFEQIYRHGCKVALFSENQWQKEKKPVKVNIEGKKEIDKFLEGV